MLAILSVDEFEPKQVFHQLIVHKITRKNGYNDAAAEEGELTRTITLAIQGFTEFLRPKGWISGYINPRLGERA